MSKRRDRHICVFKRDGIWWEHRQYFRGGEWRNCYAPRAGYEPLFSRKPLTFEEIDAYVAKQKEKRALWARQREERNLNVNN